MTLLLDGPATGCGASDDDRDGDLAATVLLRNGQRRYWRAPGLTFSADVTAWQAHALDAAHPDFAVLIYRELAQLRRAHR